MSAALTARLFRIVALAEACSWTGLLVGMALKYGPEANEVGVQVFGPIHGALFMLYVLVALVAARCLGWSAATTTLALAAAVPPLATAIFDAWANRRGLLRSA